MSEWIIFDEKQKLWRSLSCVVLKPHAISTFMDINVPLRSLPSLYIVAYIVTFLITKLKIWDSELRPCDIVTIYGCVCVCVCVCVCETEGDTIKGV
jgi:hypothetical protein